MASSRLSSDLESARGRGLFIRAIVSPEEGQMKKNTLKPVAMAIGSSVALALSVGASAAENPFQMLEFGPAVTVASEAVDMQGNKVKINDETGFSYGGDIQGKYASGKLGTGTKDPAVCGTFSGASCSMTHLKKE
jgi:hypothetical protein